MKKIALISGSIVALLAVLISSVVLMISCSKDPVVTPSPSPSVSDKPSSPTEALGDIFSVLASDGIVVISNGNSITIEVGNETTILELKKYVEVGEGIFWMLATDISMQEEIASKTVALKEGDNIFYVYCHNEDESIMENFVINIHRKGSFTVTFEGLDESQTVVEGKFATPPVGKPSKEGYEFVDWDFDFNAPITASATIYAKWAPKTYKITYDPHLGVLSGAKEISVVYGEEVTLAIPTREGFLFADWYYGDTCVRSGVWTIASDVTLTARWASANYTVTFDPNGGSMDGSLVVETAYGAAITFPVPTREGYTFGGWYDGDTICYDGIYEYTKDLNLVAKWNERSATLTFFENGGTKNSYTETLTFGEALPLPSRPGYTFGGWFSDINLTQQVKTVPESSMRLYAWWTEEGKPSEFVYEASGMSYKITARVDRESGAVVPSYIGGRKTLDAIPRPNPNPGIKLESDSVSVKIDRFGQIIATFVPKYEGDNTDLVFESNKPSIATVDPSGRITGHKTGACVVTIRNEAGGYEEVCVVIVEATAKNPNAGMTVTPSTALMIPGETLQLKVDLVSEYEDDEKILTYTSSAPTVAKVDQKGKVSILALGVCNIIITDPYGLQTVATITVVEKRPNANPGITFEQELYEVTEGDIFTIGATFIPEYEGDDDTLTWVSENSAVAAVVNGEVTALKAGACVITATGADGKYKGSVTVKIANKNPGITLDKQEIALEVGGEEQIVATFVPKYPADDATLLWSVEPADVVAVENGKITALASGVATVTVKNADGNYSATISVKVANENPGITLDKQEIALEVGKEVQIVATFVPKYPTDDETLLWSVEPADVVTVENGKITALAAGVATVTVKNADGSYSATISVKVANESSGITLDKQEVILEIGGEEQIVATFVPKYPADDQTLLWSVEPAGVVTVENGKITALAAGVATVTVKNADGSYSATISVKVANESSGITLDKQEVILEIGGEEQIVATFVPKYPTDDETLLWSVEPAGVVAVENGKITALAAGVATVTVKNADGSYSATVSVKVANENPGITLDKDSLELIEGESADVNAEFVPLYPGDATDLSWFSDEETVAIVENGRITAISEGVCVITVRNGDGSYVATVSVKVLSKKIANENPGITLDKTEVELVEGDSIFVDATFVPAYQGDNTALLWISDAEGVATVSNGTIVAVGEGSCSVVVVNADGTYSATVTVTVLAKQSDGEEPLPDDSEAVLPPEEQENGTLPPKEDPMPENPEDQDPAGDGEE